MCAIKILHMDGELGMGTKYSGHGHCISTMKMPLLASRV